MATGWTVTLGGLPTYSGGVYGISGGTVYSTLSDAYGWNFSLSMRHLGSQASGAVMINNKAYARPKGKQTCIITNNASGDNVFGGIVQHVSQKLIAPTVYEYQLTCSDYTPWLDHVPGGNKEYNDTADAVIRQMIFDWVTPLTGSLIQSYDAPAVPLTVNHVQEVPVSVFFNPNYLPISQCIDTVAKMVEAVWFIDANSDLWFLLPDSSVASTGFTLNAPYPVQPITYWDQGINTEVVELLATMDYDTDTTVRELTIDEDASTTISAVNARDYSEPSTPQLTESPTSATDNNPKLVGDGVTKFFPLNHVPVSPATCTVVVQDDGTYSVANGNMKTEYVDGQPTDPSPPDVVYVCTSNQGIRFGHAPASGKNITVSYNYYFPSGDFQSVPQLLAIIAAREGFGAGYYYQIISNPELTSPILPSANITPWQAAELIMLNRYARIKITVDFQQYFSNFAVYPSGWLPGQIFALVSTLRGDNVDNTDTQFTGWGTTFTNKMYVTQVDAQIVNDGTINYHVYAASDIWGM